ncbi:MAG: lipoyl(octanoyl) transferase LipB [bacterium]
MPLPSLPSPLHATERFAFVDLGRQDYATTWNLQKSLLAQRQKDEARDTVLFVEHDPVYTLGRRIHREDFLVPFDESKGLLGGVPVFQIERGGRITYHGPGQLVIYPVICLQMREQRLYPLMRGLEEIVLAVLKSFGVEGHRRPGITGVFTKDGKIASFGIAIKRWVTFHGISLNLDADLSYFQKIHPCGLTDVQAVNLSSYLPSPPSRRQVMDEFIRQWLALWPTLFR